MPLWKAALGEDNANAEAYLQATWTTTSWRSEVKDWQRRFERWHRESLWFRFEGVLNLSQVITRERLSLWIRFPALMAATLPTLHSGRTKPTHDKAQILTQAILHWSDSRSLWRLCPSFGH